MPATPSRMKMFGSFQRLVSILFRTNGHDQTLLPNQYVTYTADRVIQLPHLDVDCVLISEAQVVDGYQPLSTELTAIAGLAGPGLIVNDGAEGAVARSIEAANNNGLSVGNGNGVSGNPSLSLDLANLIAEGGSAALEDLMIFGDATFSDQARSMTIQQLSDLIVPAPVVSGKIFMWHTGNVKTCVHNFGTNNVMVQVYDGSGRTTYVDDVLRYDLNTVILSATGFENPFDGPYTVLITSGAGFVAG